MSIQINPNCEKRSHLVNEVSRRMPMCEGYNDHYCEPSMCMECDMLDKNLRIELDKEYDLCTRCNGYAMVDIIDDKLIMTRECNQCGGTGRFIG